MIRWANLSAEERSAFVREKWAEGLSASKIAALTIGATRNAIISNVHRQGLKRAPEISRLNIVETSRRTRAPRTPRAPKPKLIIAGCGAVIEKPEGQLPREPIPERIEAPGCCDLLSLTARTCKWPIGSPGEPGFSFCGRRKAPDAGPYCCAHAKRAYQPAEKKKTSANELARSLRKWIAA